MTAAAPVEAPAKKTYTVPAGTKVLLQLRSAINTKSAKPGDGVYLAFDLSRSSGKQGDDSGRGLRAGSGGSRCSRGAGEGQGTARPALYNDHLSQWLGGGDSWDHQQPTRHQRSLVKGDEGTVEQQGNKGRDVARRSRDRLQGAGVGTSRCSRRPSGGGCCHWRVGWRSRRRRCCSFRPWRRYQHRERHTGGMVLQRPLTLEDENLGGSSTPRFSSVPGSIL